MSIIMESCLKQDISKKTLATSNCSLNSNVIAENATKTETNVNYDIENCLLQLIETVSSERSRIRGSDISKSLESNSRNWKEDTKLISSKINFKVEIQDNSTISEHDLKPVTQIKKERVEDIFHLKSISVKCEKVDQKVNQKLEFKCNLCNHFLKSLAGLKLHQQKLHNFRQKNDSKVHLKNTSKFNSKSKLIKSCRGIYITTGSHHYINLRKSSKKDLLPVVVLKNIISVNKINKCNDSKLISTPVVVLHEMKTGADFLKGMHMNLRPVVKLSKFDSLANNDVQVQERTTIQKPHEVPPYTEISKDCYNSISEKLVNELVTGAVMLESCSEKCETSTINTIKLENNEDPKASTNVKPETITQIPVNSNQSKQVTLESDMMLEKKCNPGFEPLTAVKQKCIDNNVSTVILNISSSEPSKSCQIQETQCVSKTNGLLPHHSCDAKKDDELKKDLKTLSVDNPENPPILLKKTTLLSKSDEIIKMKALVEFKSGEKSADLIDSLPILNREYTLPNSAALITSNSSSASDSLNSSLSLPKKCDKTNFDEFLESHNNDKHCCSDEVETNSKIFSANNFENPQISFNKTEVLSNSDVVYKVEELTEFESRKECIENLENLPILDTDCNPLSKKCTLLNSVAITSSNSSSFIEPVNTCSSPSLLQKCNQANCEESLNSHSTDEANQNVAVEVFPNASKSRENSNIKTIDLCDIEPNNNDLPLKQPNTTCTTIQNQSESIISKTETCEVVLKPQNKITLVSTISSQEILTISSNSEVPEPSKIDVPQHIQLTSSENLQQRPSSENILRRRSSSDMKIFSVCGNSLTMKHGKKKRFKLKRQSINECVTCGKGLELLVSKNQNIPRSCSTCDKIISNFQAISLNVGVNSEKPLTSKSVNDVSESSPPLRVSDHSIKTILSLPVIKPTNQNQDEIYDFQDYVPKITSKPKFSFRNPRNLSFHTVLVKRPGKSNDYSILECATSGTRSCKALECIPTLEAVCFICLKKFTSELKLAVHQNCHSSLKTFSGDLVNNSNNACSDIKFKSDFDMRGRKSEFYNDFRSYDDIKFLNKKDQQLLDGKYSRILPAKPGDFDKSIESSWNFKYPPRFKNIHCFSSNKISEKSELGLVSRKMVSVTATQKDVSGHQCEVCDRRFQLFSVLKIHILTYHSKHLNCPSCFSSSCEKQFQQKYFKSDNENHQITNKKTHCSSTRSTITSLDESNNSIDTLKISDLQKPDTCKTTEKSKITSCKFLEGTKRGVIFVNETMCKLGLPDPFRDNRSLKALPLCGQMQTFADKITDLNSGYPGRILSKSSFCSNTDKSNKISTSQNEVKRNLCLPCDRVFRNSFLLERHQKSTKCKLSNASDTTPVTESHEPSNYLQDSCSIRGNINSEFAVGDTKRKYSRDNIDEQPNFQKKGIVSKDLEDIPIKKLKTSQSKGKQRCLENTRSSRSDNIKEKKKSETCISHSSSYNNSKIDASCSNHLRSGKGKSSISYSQLVVPSHNNSQSNNNSQIKIAEIPNEIRKCLRNNTKGPITYRTNYFNERAFADQRMKPCVSRNLRVKNSVCYTEDLCYAVLDQDFDFDMKQLQNLMPNSYEAARRSVQLKAYRDSVKKNAGNSETVPHKRTTRDKRRNNVPCPFCGKEFSSSDLLNRHSSSCPSRKSLSRHSTNVTKTFNCTECSRLFSRRYYLQLHMKSHSSAKRFKCGL